MTRCLEAAADLANPDPAVRLAAYVDLRREAEFDSAIESRVGLSRRAMRDRRAKAGEAKGPRARAGIATPVRHHVCGLIGSSNR